MQNRMMMKCCCAPTLWPVTFGMAWHPQFNEGDHWLKREPTALPDLTPVYRYSIASLSDPMWLGNIPYYTTNFVPAFGGFEDVLNPFGWARSITAVWWPLFANPNERVRRAIFKQWLYFAPGSNVPPSIIEPTLRRMRYYAVTTSLRNAFTLEELDLLNGMVKLNGLGQVVEEAPIEYLDRLVNLPSAGPYPVELRVVGPGDPEGHPGGGLGGVILEADVTEAVHAVMANPNYQRRDPVAVWFDVNPPFEQFYGLWTDPGYLAPPQWRILDTGDMDINTYLHSLPNWWTSRLLLLDFE